jgi:hypothetical protein
VEMLGLTSGTRGRQLIRVCLPLGTLLMSALLSLPLPFLLLPLPPLLFVPQPLRLMLAPFLFLAKEACLFLTVLLDAQYIVLGNFVFLCAGDRKANFALRRSMLW